MSPHADWGTLLIETDVDRAVLTCLAEWMPVYLSRVEAERSLPNGLLARPHEGSFQNVLDDDTFPDGRLPAIVATTAQMQEVESGPSREYGAAFDIVVSAIIRGRTAPETREVAAVFAGCVRRILVHQQLSIDGEIKLAGGRIAPVPDETDAGRYLAAGISRFRFYADTVLNGDGPVDPTEGDPEYPPRDPDDPAEPYDPLATVTAVTTTITEME